MAKRAIGIEIGPDRIRAVQLRRTRRELRLERIHTQLISDDGRPGKDPLTNTATALKSIMRKGNFRAGLPIAVAMPPGCVVFQTLETDLPDAGLVRRVIKFEMEEDFPLPVEDLVLDTCGTRELPNEKRTVLVAGVKRSTLQEKVATLAAAGLECSLAAADVCALHEAVVTNHPDATKGRVLIVYLSDSRTILAAGENGNLLTGRNLARPANGDAAGNEYSTETALMLAREIELSWRDTFSNSIPSSTPLILGGDPDLTQRLSRMFQEELPCRVTMLNPFASIACPGDQETDPRFAVAIGLALEATRAKPRGANFLLADSLKEDQAAGVRKGLTFAAILVGAVVAAWIAGLFLQRHALESRYSDVKAEMKEIFRTTVPEEKNIVDELKQIEDRLQALRKEHDTFSSVAHKGMSRFRILQCISAKIPAHLNVRISEMSILGDSVRLTGATDSVGAVDEVRSALLTAPEFSTVVPQDVAVASATGTVQFTLSIAVRAE